MAALLGKVQPQDGPPHTGLGENQAHIRSRLLTGLPALRDASAWHKSFQPAAGEVTPLAVAGMQLQILLRSAVGRRSDGTKIPRKQQAGRRLARLGRVKLTLWCHRQKTARSNSLRTLQEVDTPRGLSGNAGVGYDLVPY